MTTEELLAELRSSPTDLARVVDAVASSELQYVLVPLAALKGWQERDPGAWRKVEAWLIARGTNVMEVQPLPGIGNRGRRKGRPVMSSTERPPLRERGNQLDGAEPFRRAIAADFRQILLDPAPRMSAPARNLLAALEPLRAP